MIRLPRQSRRLRVLMVCTRYRPELGGIETHVGEVAKRLAHRGDFDVTVLATDRTRALPRHELIDDTNVLRVPAWPRNRDYYLAPGIGRIVGQSNKWDLIHCQGIHTPVPLQAMLAARRANIPYVVSFHTGGHSLHYRNALRSAQWRLAGPLLRQASALIGVSRFEAETIARSARLNPKTVSVIRNGGTLPSPPPGTTPVPGRVVTVGRLERYKGHHRVVEALPALLQKMANAHVVILGSGPYERQLRKIASHIGMADKVTIKHIPPSDRLQMATELAKADVVAALSDYEAHPVAVMEALSTGRPVIGYDVAGIGDLVTEGWVQGVPPGAPPAEVARIMVEAMSSSVVIEASQLPTWDGCAEQLSRAYLEALRGNSDSVDRSDIVTSGRSTQLFEGPRTNAEGLITRT